MSFLTSKPCFSDLDDLRAYLALLEAVPEVERRAGLIDYAREQIAWLESLPENSPQSAEDAASAPDAA